MAKDNFWENDAPVAADEFWKSDKPAAQRDLPAGVTPSTAGAGRGSVVPAVVATPEPSQRPQNLLDTATDWALGVPLEGDGKGSVLEVSRPEDPAFNFKDSSAAFRKLQDQQDRMKEHGTAGPVVGPKASVETIGTGLASDLVAGAKGARAGINQMIGDATDSQYLQDQARKEQGQSELMSAMNTPQFESDTARGVYGGLSSLVRQTPALAAAVVTKNPSLALGGMVAPMVPEEYAKFRQRGAAPMQALPASIAMAATEYLTEKAPMSVLVNKFGKVGASRFLAEMLAKEIPGEQVATAVQDAIDTATANPDKTWGDYIAERPDAAYQTLIATVTQGGIMSAANAGARALSNRLQPEDTRPAQPSAEDIARKNGFLAREQRIKTLSEAGDTAAADLLQKRHERLTAIEQVDTELQRMAMPPEAAQVYRNMRGTGMKPAEAAARAAVTTTFQGFAVKAGIPNTALTAALNKANGMPLDEAPTFLQKFTAALEKRGMAQPGAINLSEQLEAARDDAIEVAMEAVYSPESIQAVDNIARLLNPEQQDGTPSAVSTVPAAGAPVSTTDAAGTVAPGSGLESESGVDQARSIAADLGPVAGLPNGVPDAAVRSIDQAAHEAATSPLNDIPQPTDAQKEAGNYKVGRINLHGLNISIENPKGSERSGTSPDGTKWSNQLAAHYGYIRGTEGNDGDHVDTFIGPNPASQKVFVVDQVNKDGSFDEHKVLLGADTIEQADALYHANYHAGWTGRGAITEMPISDFKAWVRDGVKTKPVSNIKTNQATNVQNPQAPTISAPVEAPGETPQAVAGNAATATGVPATRAGSVEGGGVTQPAFTSKLRPSGTLSVQGDFEAVKRTLTAGGIDPKKITKSTAGAVVGASQAKLAQEILNKPQEPANAKSPEAIQDQAQQPQAPAAGVSPVAGVQNMVLRQENAANRFIDSAMEQFSLDKDTARAALDHMVKKKLVKLDSISGQFQLKDGRFWDGDALRNAAALNSAAAPAPAPKPKKKPAGARNLRAAAYDKNPLMTFLATHGLYHAKDDKRSQKSEYSKDKGIMVMGYGPVFKRTGKQPSDLVVNAIQEGYLPADGTVGQLDGLIRRAIAGEKISPMYAEGVAEQMGRARIDAQPQYEDFLDAAQQDPMDSDPFGPLDLEILDEVGFNEAPPDTQAEFRAIIAHAESMGIDAEMILMEVTDQVGSQATQQEFYETAITTLKAAVEGSSGNGSEVSGAQSAEVGTAETGQEGLESYTEADVLTQQARAEQAEKDEVKADKDAEAKARDERIAKEIQSRQEASAENFQLGQSAEDALAGQGDIFSTPAEPDTKPASEMSAAELLRAAADKIDAAEKPATIADVGEKIGGARKDTVTSTGKKSKAAAPADDRPTWAKRFTIGQIAGGFDIKVNGQDVSGKWTISDQRLKDWTGQPKQMGGYFDTKEAAEAALPLIAVAQKHRVTTAREYGPDGTLPYEIWRDISDSKRVKVVDKQFATRVEAMEYMAKNAVEILETTTTFGEADLPKPESTQRIGAQRRTADVTGEDFKNEFGFRGVEFGNWNNQTERQEIMNEAYDGLMDLAEVLGVPPKAIGLNGDLALAFGARGQGLSSARAHYERDRVVMNLTKMNGAGALAHEWFHALDHYLGRQDGKASSDWIVNPDGTRSLSVKGAESDMASGGFKRANSGVREELRNAYKTLMQTIFYKAEQYVEDTAKADKFVGKTREELQKELESLRKDLSEQKDVRYYKRNNKPASAEQLAEFDAIAAELVEGRGLATEWKTLPGKSRLSIQSRHTNDALEKISELYKAVRGRAGFNADRSGVADSLRSYMSRYEQRLKMLADANSSETKTKNVPTSFAMDAKSLDQGRGTDYWTTPHEMAARAFQGYVEDMITAKNGQSPFLNYAPEDVGVLTPWGVKRPYPAGAERKAMNSAFDAFVQTIQTKETNQGVAMFSRGLPENPTTVTALQQAVREFTGTFLKNSLGRVVATTAAEIKSTWEPLIDKSVNIDSEGDAGVAQAFYDAKSKTVFLIADHIAAGNETAVLAHELMHAHGQAVLGKEGWDRLHGVINTWKDAPAGSEERTIYQFARNKVDAVGLELSSQEFFPYAVEAAIRMGIKPSMAAKKGTVAHWLESVRQNLQQVWGKITGKPETFKAQDLVDLAFGIAQRENPENASISIGAVDKNRTDTAAFKAWFGDSKVVDDKGQPLVVYHGTNKSEQGNAFTQFDTYASNYGLMGMGGYFTADPMVASTYTSKGRGDSPTVYSVYLAIKNPIDMEAKADVAAWKKQFDDIEQYHEGGNTNEAWYRAAEESLADQEIPKYEGAEIMQDGLRAMGFDGITHIGGGRVKSDGVRHRVYVAFDPEQIKSATGNNGNFDPTNPDIRFSRSRLGLASVPGGYADDVVVRAISDKLSGTGNSVTLVSSFADLPKRVKDAVDDPRGLKGLAYGRGEVFVIQDEIHSRQELEAVIIHELYGHVGIRSLFGPETYSRLNKLALSLGDAKIAELIKKYKLDENGYAEYAKQFEANSKMTRRAGGAEEMRRGWLMEEALAHIAEHETGTLKQLALEVVGQIRAWLRDHGFLELSNLGMSDIANILKLSRQAAFSGPGVFDVPMFSRTADAGGRVDSDAPTKTMSSAWRDGTNRLQFAPGAWLYDKLGNMAHPWLVKLQMSQANPELKRQIRQMKLEVQKAQDTAVAVATEANKLSTAERRMVSDIIEKELASGIVPPSHAVRLAATMSAAMTQQSEELVRLGMLSQEAVQRWDGAYLPRFYESKLTGKVKDAWADAMSMLRSRPRAMQGIKGRSLKGRGLYETVPVADLQQYQTMGWEVRDPDFDARKDKEVQVWRDYTRAERDKMGEIRDAGFRFVMGYMQTQKDVALGRMFEGMAGTIASRLDKQGYVRVPDTKVQGTGASRYGRLAGLYVPLEVMTHLSQVEESANASLQMYRKAMSLWKEGKTVLNPVSHVNNIVSNLSMAHFGGVSYHRGDKYLAAMKDFATKSPALLEAREAGLFLGSMSEVELMNTLPPELRALAKQADSSAARGAKWVYNAMNYFLRRPMGAAYSAEDTFFRYLLYKDARGRGMERNDAVDYAQRYIFTYDDLPKTARMIRDFGIPFFAYTYKAAPALLHTALTYPHRFAAPAAVLWAANAAAYAIAAGDDDDWMESLQRYLTDAEFRAKVRENEDLERENLPPWMKGSTALMSPKAIRLGMDEVTKLPMFLDVSRLVPGGDVFDVSPNAGGLPIPQPITPSHPLFTTLVAMIGNKDLFFGKEITDSNDTQGEATEKRLDWLWRQFSPAIAAGNYHWQRGMNALAQATGTEVRWTAALPDSIEDKIPEAIAKTYTGIGRDGLPVQPKLAAVQTFGIKARPIDLDTSADISESQQDAMIRKIDAEMRSLKRLNDIGAVSDRVYDKAQELSWTKKDRIEAGLTVDGKPKQ